MTRAMIKRLMAEAIEQQKIANYFIKYNENYYNLIPLKTSEQLFSAIKEDDFVLNGFRISRFRDIKEMRIKDDKCDEVIRVLGLLDNLQIPAINLDSWSTVFESLKVIGKNIIVEYETPEGVDDDFTIGKIVQVYKSCVYIHHFDADGVWQPEPYRIPYTQVTSVTFDSRYVTVFSQHISPAPNS